MRLRIPFGRKGLLAAAAIAAGVYWRVCVARREADDMEWDADIHAAVDEGVAAGRAAAEPGGGRSLSLAQLGYANQVELGARLRVAASRRARYIVVAKRAAAGFAAVAGLDVEALDDLVIAVAQACENAVTLTERVAGPGNGHIRLLFNLADKSLDVDVRGSLSRAELEVAAQRQAVAVARAALEEQAREAEMSMRLMGLFVDDCRYRVDERTGGLRSG